MGSQPGRFIRLVSLAMLALAVAAGVGAYGEESETCDEADAQGLLSGPGATFTVPESDVPQHWSLIAYGDMRFTDPANEKVTNPTVRRWLVGRIAQEHPDAVLLSGDVPYDGSVANDYAVYQAETAPWRAANLRVYPAMGNHELHAAEVQHPKNWWAAFPQLANRRWYSVKFGNAYILTVDSNLCLGEGSRQRGWIVDQLDHLPAGTKFVFVSMHHPPVTAPIRGDPSHSGRPNEQALAALLQARAPSITASIIVIAGHVHNYERFLQGGVVYLVSGGGGATPKPLTRISADHYQDPAFPNYHYLKFVYDGSRLNATMYRVADPSATPMQADAKDTFTVEQKTR